MAHFFGALFITLFLTLSIHLFTVSAKGCSKEKGCEKNECCIDKGLFTEGVCKSLSKEGESCHHESDQAYFISGKYKDNCPCQETLICEPTKVESWFIFGNKKVNEKCIFSTQKTVDPVVETTKTPVQQE